MKCKTVTLTDGRVFNDVFVKSYSTLDGFIEISDCKADKRIIVYAAYIAEIIPLKSPSQLYK